MPEEYNLITAIYRGILAFIASLFVILTTVYHEPIINALLIACLATCLKIVKDMIEAYLREIDKK